MLVSLPEATLALKVALALAVLLPAAVRVSAAQSHQPPDIPRPEHPLPQIQRAEWLNLNGVWEFAETDENQDELYLSSAPYPDKILVPFCRESRLSGLQRTGFVKNVWYRRTFALPASWKSPRTRLHIGASDWRTRVWVNGVFLGQHTGGSAPFAFEITHCLKAGENTIVVAAYDDTRSGLQALGKQSAQPESHGAVYTRTTGIWQTVWLEGVGESFISAVRILPDPAGGRAVVQVDVDGASKGLEVTAEALANGAKAGSAQAPAVWRDNQLIIPLSRKRIWSPETPFLYDLKLSLRRGKDTIDSLHSYFGLRDVRIQGPAILINGKRVFQRLVLDQGFYPEGIWTAPSDEALHQDILLSKAVGFNGARLHQKVFEPRFLYWADREGYLCWGEYPNWGLDYARPEANLPVVSEWTEIVGRDRNHPCIIGWCPFNETPPSAGELQNTIVALTRALDPSRPVIDSSGWTHTLPDPEVLDAHDYDQNPASFRHRFSSPPALGALPARYGGEDMYRGIPFFVSEYGGIKWNPTGEGWGYGTAPKDEAEFYERYKGLTDALLDNPLMFGFCYTQLTDVEQERNGLYTYDRKPKWDVARIHAMTQGEAAYEKSPPAADRPVTVQWATAVGAAVDENHKPWRYSLDTPPADWAASDFDDSAWKSGQGGFGQKDHWQSRTGTPWTTPDIWLRQSFALRAAPGERVALIVHFDNDAQVYLNGHLIWTGEGWTDRYAMFDVTDKAQRALKKGDNTIAIHCHQDSGGQFIDAALLIEE